MYSTGYLRFTSIHVGTTPLRETGVVALPIVFFI